MAGTRNALEQARLYVDESMGLRRIERSTNLSPVPAAKDAGRIPLRTFGKVEVDRIVRDPSQPRREFDDDDIQRLAASIRSHGQLHPIRVRWNDLLRKWIIVTGERRYRATCAAGLPAIDCFFIDGELSEAELREQQLVENLLRKDLTPIEEAKAFLSLMELNDWNGKQVAEALRVTTSRVSRALALLDLPESVQRQVESGILPKSSAYEISKLDSEQQRKDLACQAAKGNLTHAKTKNRVNQRRGKRRPKLSQGVRQVFHAENGLKVTVSSNAKANYHEVEQALIDALEEVRLRIDNNVTLF